ncbi:heavy metal-associated isoprenylated plant protein 3-like [Bidens hawaiensis]|uniref:heavy metal-associated isoprenylated plant protein 3-like n=1 Tax=Bidens hawaiensis TaxID=980011 RepID=UPI0040496562
MAKKKTQVNNENDGGNSGGDGGKKQKAADIISVVVLKIDLHCEGCAGRVVKAVRTLDGVESVRIGDSELNKLTVIGYLDPVKLRQKVEEKTKKKVEVLSPAAKKANDGDNAGGENKKKQQKVSPEKDLKPPAKTARKNGGEKPKEIPVTMAVLKVPLHCQGCIRKIHKLVTKTKGYMDMSLDKTKDLVAVKGAIDMKLLAEALQHKLKRAVEIVPGKKEGDGEKKGGGGEKKGKGGGGNANGGEGKDGGGGGEKKGKNKGGGEGNGGGDGKPEMFKMETYGGPIGYPYPQYAYGPGYAEYVHAPQLFSDENPNGCVVM